MRVRTNHYFGSIVVLSSALLCGSAVAQNDALTSHAVSDQAPTLIASVAPEALALPVAPVVAASSESSSSAVDAALPDAPTPVMPQPAAEPMTFGLQSGQSLGTAKKNSMIISAGWKAPRLTAKDKVVAGLVDQVSPMSLAAIVLSAGYSHLTNGQPNYGVNREAFGKRVGAAAARTTSQGVFTEVVLAPLLHEDARYYVKGPQYGFFNRTIYAITRPIIGRTDGGRSTVNASLILGYAGAAALTPLYYPDINHNFHDVASTFGGSLGGAAIGFFVSEFSDQILQAIHLKKK